VSELNRTLWNSGLDSDKEIARKQKRKLSYYSNIYVVSDPAHPENEGKVFLFKYGKKIFDKIQEAMKPEFQDETPVNPFDLWEGANFKLKIKKVAGYWNYDSSEFASPSTLEQMTDSELEKVWKSEYALQEFLDAKNFKSYEELESRLNVVLARTPNKRVDPETAEDEGDFNGPDIMARSSRPVFNTVAERTAPKNEEQELRQQLRDLQPTASSDEDDTLSYFARLAEEE